MSNHADPSSGAWRRSSRCVAEHHCVEIFVSDDSVRIRNSQQPDACLEVGRAEWLSIVSAVKTGILNAPTC